MDLVELDTILGRVLLATLPLTVASCIGGGTSCPDEDATYIIVKGPDAGATGVGGAGGGEGGCMALCGRDSAGAEPIACAPDAETDGTRCKYPVICEGRRPAGLRGAPPPRRAGLLGEHFAMVAFYEAASVPAFEALARELQAHGAPAHLCALARRGARDEARHAKSTAALARRFGCEPVRPDVEPRPVRPLLDVALENAREGCVRETYGALVARWQARAATDAAVRAVMKTIARDEARHAALGWAVAAWARSRLSHADRSRLDHQRRAAFAELGLAASGAVPESLVRVAGLPRPAHAAALVAELSRELAAA